MGDILCREDPAAEDAAGNGDSSLAFQEAEVLSAYPELSAASEILSASPSIVSIAEDDSAAL